MFAIVPHIFVPDSIVEIVHLDFLTETSHVLLSTHAPHAQGDIDNPFLHPRICGDVAAVSINTTKQIILMNWKTKSSIILLSSSVR